MAESLSATISKENILVKIFGSAGLIAVLTLLVKAVAMGKEMLVAHRFGVGDELDCFLMAYLLPQLLINVIAGAYAASFVPAFSRALNTQSKRYAEMVLQESSLLVIILLLGSSLVLYTLLPTLLPVIASGYDPEKLAQTQHLAQQLLPVILLNGLSRFFAGVLNTRHRYVMPALLPIFTPLAIMLCLIGTNHFGIEILTIGTVSGSAMEFLALLLVLRIEDWSLLPQWHAYLPESKQIIRQFKPMIVGALIMSGTDIVDQSMAAMVGMPAGSVAALSYGNKAIAVILGLGSIALGTAVFSHFSEMVAHQQWQLAYRVLNHSLKLVFLLTLPVVGLLFVFSEDIVSLLYQRGQFSSEDAKLVAQIQICYGLQLPFYLSGIIAVKLVSAMHRNDILLKISVLSFIANIIGNYAFIRWLGVSGIALSTALVYALSTFFICLIIHIMIYKKKLYQ